MEEDETDMLQDGPGVTVFTETVVAHVTVPPGPVAVPVYVVEPLGVTVIEPPDTGVTLPTPWSITNEFTLVVFQVRVVAPPELTLEGEAVSVQVGVGCTTVTGAVQFTVPPAPVAVSV